MNGALTYTLTVQGIWKHSYMTRNLCTKQQDKEKKWLAYSSYSAQLRLHGSTLQWTFERLQPHTVSSNASNMLELYATLSMPDLGTHAYMHVSCVKKVILPCLGQKTYSFLFLLALFDLKSSLWKAERPGNMLAVSK